MRDNTKRQVHSLTSESPLMTGVEKGSLQSVLAGAWALLYSPGVGTWAEGPFDNDIAADWCNELNDAPASERPKRVRAALMAVVNEADYLESMTAHEAVAAAAVVASQRPGGRDLVRSVYAPDFLQTSEGQIELPAELRSLALEVLGRVAGAESEWRESWEDADDGGVSALAQLAVLRDLLEEDGTTARLM